MHKHTIHGLSFGAGQHGLGLDAAAEFLVQAFDRVGGPCQLPLPYRFVRKVGGKPGSHLGGNQQRDARQLGRPRFSNHLRQKPVKAASAS